MFCVENFQRITKYALLSLLCFDSVFSAAIESTQTLGDYQEVIFDEYEDKSYDAKDGDFLRLDFFRYTTRKRYVWEDWDDVIPTNEYEKHKDTMYDTFFLYLIVAIGVTAILALAVVAICRNSEFGCCSAESNSSSSISSSRFTTVHPPPQRAGVSQVNNHAFPVHATGTVAFVNFSYTSASHDGRQSDNIVTERPPDYSVVTMNDLVNPTQPAFPVVKSDKETPPPEYDKRNPF